MTLDSTRQGSFAPPLISLVDCTLYEANGLLKLWRHRMGEFRRPNNRYWCHVLLHHDEPVSVLITSAIIGPTVASLPWSTRENTVELARLCAARPGLCRVALRLWREFVFPALGYEWAISYQDAGLHTGATYRFDGWRRAAWSHSGTDTRSGRPGRNKWIWVWPPKRVLHERLTTPSKP